MFSIKSIKESNSPEDDLLKLIEKLPEKLIYIQKDKNVSIRIEKLPKGLIIPNYEYTIV